MAKVAPVILTSYPSNGEMHVSIYRTIKIVLDECVYNGPNYSDISMEDCNGEPVEIMTFIHKNYLFIDPVGPLEKGMKYFIWIPEWAVMDCEGNLLEFPYRFFFVTGGDSTPPRIISTDPINKAEDVLVSAKMLITFSEIIKPCENYCSIALKSTFGYDVPIIRNISGAVLTIEPIIDLEPGTQYELIIPARAVCDFSENPLDCTFILEFTTQGETEGPVVIDSDPENEEVCVNVWKTIVVTFNKKIRPAEAFREIQLLNELGLPVRIKNKLRGNKLFIKPCCKLLFDANYNLQVPEEAVKDCLGNLLEDPFDITFKTEYGYCGEGNKI
ncbi:MAG: Ig-like domain-containing protein [Anaerotignum sp.]|nr:Ig-like domain-containing protein [Anaerotignum sp.]